MQKNDFAKYKSMLEAKLAQLSNPFDKRADIAIEKAPDLLDAVQLTAERELALHDVSRRSRLAREVRPALKRIDDGSYGICLNCEVEVTDRRLEAVPWAAYCVGCQEATERRESELIELVA